MSALWAGVTMTLAGSRERVTLVPGRGEALAVDANRTTPRAYRRLTGRKHPEISRIRTAYRQRQRRRGGRRG